MEESFDSRDVNRPGFPPRRRPADQFCHRGRNMSVIVLLRSVGYDALVVLVDVAVGVVVVKVVEVVVEVVVEDSIDSEFDEVSVVLEGEDGGGAVNAAASLSFGLAGFVQGENRILGV